MTGETKLSATAGRLVITGRERVKDSGEGQIVKNFNWLESSRETYLWKF